MQEPPGRLYSLFRSPLPTPPDLGETSAFLGSVFSVVLFSVLEDRGLELERFFLS